MWAEARQEARRSSGKGDVREENLRDLEKMLTTVRIAAKCAAGERSVSARPSLRISSVSVGASFVSVA